MAPTPIRKDALVSDHGVGKCLVGGASLDSEKLVESSILSRVLNSFITYTKPVGEGIYVHWENVFVLLGGRVIHTVMKQQYQ